MICPNCTKDIPNESIFCQHCGHKIPSTFDAQNLDDSNIDEANQDSAPYDFIPNFDKLKIAFYISLPLIALAALAIILTVAKGDIEQGIIGLGPFFSLYFFLSTYKNLKEIKNKQFAYDKLLTTWKHISGIISVIFGGLFCLCGLIIPFFFFFSDSSISASLVLGVTAFALLYIIAGAAMIYYSVNTMRILKFVDGLEFEDENKG